MRKVIQSTGYNFGEPVSTLLKQSRRGLLGDDRDVFRKRASTNLWERVEKLAAAADEPLAHLLIIGGTEFFGANRNGDGFKVACCRTYHPTFVKYARFYRNHKNTDPAQSYGRILLSSYNEPMGRIELIVAFNGSKEAAARNGGLVADLELERLAKGQDIGVSMACKIARDVCSYCGHKSASPAEYCTATEHGGHCKAGGLFENMGAIVDIDGSLHQLHADNPDPTFYDCSNVFRPADRTAYVTGLIKKVANTHGVVSSSKLAELLEVGTPYNVLVDTAGSIRAHALLKAAVAVARLETELQAGELDAFPDRLAAAFATDVQPVVAPPNRCIEKQAEFLRACTDEQILLPLPQFLRIFGNCGLDKLGAISAQVRAALPGAVTRLLSRPDAETIIATNPYLAGAATSTEFSTWAHKHAAEYSLADRCLQRRAATGSIRCDGRLPAISRGLAFHKQASADDDAQRVAEEYALYQLGFLSSKSAIETELPLTAPLVLLHNHTVAAP